MPVFNFDKVSDVGSWWNFHRSFWRVIPIIWHQLQVNQEPPCPPWLQEETWRTMKSWQGFWCWILIKLSQKLLKGDPYHLTLPPGSSGTSMSSMTPGRDLKDRWSLDKVSDVGSWWNFHRSFRGVIPIIWHHLQVNVLHDSRKRLGGKVESWQGFWCWIFMKLSQKLLKDDPYCLTPPPC